MTSAYKQGRGGDRESWLSIHRAGSVLVDRKQDRAIIAVPRAFVGVCGGIQPRTLKRLLTGDFFECGLPARLLLAAPPSPRKRWTDAEIPAAVEAAMARAEERLHGISLCRGEDDEPDRGEHERADALRRRLAALGVSVSLRVGRPARRRNGGAE